MSVEEIRVQIYEGRPRLVDGKLGPIREANTFLNAMHARGLTPQTIRAYAFDLLVFYRWMKKTDRHLHALKPTDLLFFIEAQRENGAHPHSINRRLTTCRLLYRFCTDRELDWGQGTGMSTSYHTGRRRDHLGLDTLRRRPGRKLRVKAPVRIVEPLNPKQVRQFLRSLSRYRDIAIVHLMLLCGLRSQEVLDLELNDINFDDNRLRVRGKGGKERVLPLPDILLESLADYIRLERPADCSGSSLFVVLQGQRRGQRMTAAGLRSLFRHRRRDPALAMANPHRFRHTFGTDMARFGVRLPVLQKMMGHIHTKTTLQYINLSMDDVVQEYKRAIDEIRKRYESP